MNRRSIALFALCMVSSAQAQNLVTNPDFDTDIAQWLLSVGVGSITHDASEGSPSPGAMRFVGSAPRVGLSDEQQGTSLAGREDGARGTSNNSRSACIPAAGGTRYDLFAQIKIISGAAGSAGVIFFPETDCSGSSTFGGVVQSTIVDGTWRTISSVDFEAPSGTQSAQVFLTLGVGFPATQFLGFFDTVRFGPTGTVPVTLQSFEVE